MPWVDDVAAVMQIWFPGEALGDAVADVLLGDAEPGGRLPVTIPQRLEDTPAFGHHPGRDGKAVYAEGRLIGYRWYDARAVEPRFPFGHGLGYTTFALGPATLTGTVDDAVGVAVRVTNTGARAGSTVVQCYVEPPRSGEDDQPLRTLGGFVKVALAPGASTTAELVIDRRAFATWDVGAHAWVVPTGQYAISVGTSSRALAPAGVVTAAG
jgi:beta-glucosidase